MNKFISKLIFGVKKNSPTILLVAGAAGCITATVIACRNTMKLKETLENGSNDIQELKADMDDAIEEVKSEMPDVTEKELKKAPVYKAYRRDICKQYAKNSLEVAKLYVLPAGIMVASIGTLFLSNDIWRKRSAQLLAACAATETAFKEYRKNVRETYGDEIDRNMLYGIKSKEITVVETDKKGKEKEVTKKLDVITDDKISDYSMYSRFFDSSCREWTKDPAYNKAFLQAREKEANLRLRSQGHLFLNEVYDMLGFERTQYGQVVGWIFDLDCPNGDNEVNFGIMDLHKEKNRDFINEYEPVILLDFNVDGVIVDKI